MRNSARAWVWVWVAWAYFYACLPCHALAEPKAAVFGGVPIIDEKGKETFRSRICFWFLCMLGPVVCVFFFFFEVALAKCPKAF